MCLLIFNGARFLQGCGQSRRLELERERGAHQAHEQVVVRQDRVQTRQAGEYCAACSGKWERNGSVWFGGERKGEERKFAFHIHCK